MLEADTKKKRASRISTSADGRPPSLAIALDCCPIIAGSDVLQLVARYGSPLIVMVEATLRKKYRSAYAALSARYPRVKFAWSYKTNYLKAICNILPLLWIDTAFYKIHFQIRELIACCRGG